MSGGQQTVRVTMAQALVRFLANQWIERDGERQRFFAGCFGIFGHGNLAGVGQALQQFEGEEGVGLRYLQARNEQGMVHTAIAYAKQRDRLQTFACTASVGPGATNMVTGAATATINRLPVLLLPGDVFASRRPDPVLQQLEHSMAGDVSVNDCFRPVSKYFDRIMRPEQLVPAALRAMQVLTDPAETGAVTLALPQDVQAEAFEYPAEFFAERTWRIAREVDHEALFAAMELIRGGARRPLIVAGGGVRYSDATGPLCDFVDATGIPVAETQAGKGSLPFDHPLNLGALGATGTKGANLVARDADLVIGIGTRYSDFTTASHTLFANPRVRFININVTKVDAYKFNAHPVVGDAGYALANLTSLMSPAMDADTGSTVERVHEVAVAGHQMTLPEHSRWYFNGYSRPIPGAGNWRVEPAYEAECRAHSEWWDDEVDRLYAGGARTASNGSLDPRALLPSQAEVIGAVNAASGPRDVVVCAAGSLPGDLHKLWRTRDPKGYHLEYGYSCMGYEVAGAVGVRLADPTREVYAMVGDGSWLMLSSELVTAVQEGIKITVVLIDNHGFGSIGALSRSLGSGGFGTEYRRRTVTGQLDGDPLPVDYAANARSLGAHVIACSTIAELRAGLVTARDVEGPVVLTIEADPAAGVGGYESWWDVPVAEVSESGSVRAARREYERERQRERWHLAPAPVAPRDDSTETFAAMLAVRRDADVVSNPHAGLPDGASGESSPA